MKMFLWQYSSSVDFFLKSLAKLKENLFNEANVFHLQAFLCTKHFTPEYAIWRGRKILTGCLAALYHQL